MAKTIEYRGKKYYEYQRFNTMWGAKKAAKRLEKKGFKTHIIKKEAFMGPDIKVLYTRPKV